MPPSGWDRLASNNFKLESQTRILHRILLHKIIVRCLGTRLTIQFNVLTSAIYKNQVIISNMFEVWALQIHRAWNFPIIGLYVIKQHIAITFYLVSNEMWFLNYGKVNCLGLFQGTILSFAWKDWGKEQNTSVTTTGTPAYNQTWHLPSTSQMVYHCVNLLSNYTQTDITIEKYM
jgi:hypothetical protein